MSQIIQSLAREKINRFVHFIPNYSDGSNYRTALNLSGFHADSDKSDIYMEARTWRNGGGIDSFTLKPEVGSNFIAGSMLSTYLIPDSDGANTIIDRQELTGTQNPISFTSIPTTYQHFEVISYTRLDRSSTSHFGTIGFNGETEGNQYSKVQFMAGFGSSFYNATSSDAEGMGLIWTRGNNSASNHFNAGAGTALNYLMTDRHKMFYGLFGGMDSGSTDDGIVLIGKRGKITAAINRFDYDTNSGSFNWMADSVVVLRGISNEIPDPPVTFIPETRMF